jgi:hypothetical protein
MTRLRTLPALTAIWGEKRKPRVVHQDGTAFAPPATSETATTMYNVNGNFRTRKGTNRPRAPAVKRLVSGFS